MVGRSRWAALGAVVAVCLGGGGLLTASAAGSATASSFVPITPCRLLDTRPENSVGLRATPLGPDEEFVVMVWGTNGNCTIPAGTTGVSTNVTIINPSAASFLTVFPSGGTRPLTSNLNWVPGQAATPNSVIAPVSASGRTSLYNHIGTVDVVVDIVGYYEPANTGPQLELVPAVDQFTPTQLVKGAVLTCATTFSDASMTACNSPLLNGVQIVNGESEAVLICSVVTSNIWAQFGGQGAPISPLYAWDGSSWVLTIPTAVTLPSTGVTCRK